MLIHDALEDYIRLHLARQKQPHKAISILRCHLPSLPNKPLEALTRLDVVEWRNAISVTAPTSANKVVGYLRHCYNLMTDWELYTGKNPCDRVKRLPRPKRERVVQPHEMPILLKAIDKDHSIAGQCAVLISMYTGLRKHEVIGLEWQHFDMLTGRGVYPTAKGGKPYKFTLPVDVLKRLKTIKHDGTRVFQVRTGKPWTDDTIDEPWYRIRARAGLDDLHFHDLRRTFCAWLDMIGTPTHRITKLMNHSSTQTTDAYRGNIDLSDQDEAIRAALAKRIQHCKEAIPTTGPAGPASPPAPIAPASVTPSTDPEPSSSAWHYGGPDGSA